MKPLMILAMAPLLLSACITVHTARPLVRDDLAQAGIVTMYDDHHDLHVVQMLHLKVPSTYTDGELHLQAYSREKGLRIRRPEKIRLAITASGLQPERLDTVTQITLTSDGKSVTLPVEHPTLGTVSGVLEATPTLQQFQALARAKQAGGKIGPYTFTIHEPARKRMLALIEALTTPQPEPAK